MIRSLRPMIIGLALFFAGCVSGRPDRDTWSGSPMVGVPKVVSWNAVSRDFRQVVPPAAFGNSIQICLELDRVPDMPRIDIRTPDSNTVLGTVELVQPDEITPILFAVIPQEMIKGREAVSLDLFFSSRVTGYPGQLTVVLAPNGVTEYDVRSDHNERSQLALATDRRDPYLPSRRRD